MMEATVRAFVAIKLPEAIVDHAGALQDALKDRGLKLDKLKWVKPRNLHLTLNFLGEIPESDVSAVGSAMGNAAGNHTPLDLAIQGMGVFPGIKRPRVLWIGFGGEVERLRQLQARLEDEFELLGYDREKRGFKAHLTLARIKGAIAPDRMLGAIEAVGHFSPRSFIARELILYKSDLRPTGAVYTPLEKIEL